jgi:flagellar basal-body rod protein FlgB
LAAWYCGDFTLGTLLEVASLQARWLSARQAVTAENVANASTPGYKAREVVAFDAALARFSGAQNTSVQRNVDGTPWEVRPSGNSVSLEEEMVRASDISRSYALNTGIVSAFHRMLLQAVRG